MTQHPHLRVVIVGGVAGGMSCATRLRRLDEFADITIVQQDPFISYANCGLPYALGNVITDEKKLHVQTPEKIEAWFNVKVRNNTEATAIDRSTKSVTVRAVGGREEILPYDKLVLAQGAEAFIPAYEGANSPHVFKLLTIPDLQAIKKYITSKPPRHVAVIGGGFIGLEAVENLRNLSLPVSLLEYLPQVMPPLDADFAEMLHKELRDCGVSLHLSARISKIVGPTTESEGYILMDSGQKILADLVLISVGVRARLALAKSAGLACGNTGLTVNSHMQTSDSDIYGVGDMVETYNRVTHEVRPLALAGPANREGRIAADHIAGQPIRDGYRGSVGTAVCKVFGLTVGMVGASPSTLARMATRGDHPPLVQYVTVHPTHHAGYYPGATPISLRVAFDGRTGLLLGAQAIGREGVDKRIDVLAVALQASMTIEDVEHMELGYAPPYGSAKDPVNMAGFVGGNVLRGDVQIVHAADLAKTRDSNAEDTLRNYTVLDVRSAEEFGHGHIKGAINVPIGKLREYVDEGQLSREKPVLVYCFVGYRGYLGYRILKQKGYGVFNLDGGYKAVELGGYSSLLQS